MTTKQKTLCAYWQISADYMQAIEDSGDRIELHHTDVNLKKEDPERYAQFLSSDVIPIPQKEHLKLHKKGVKHTKTHNEKIGDSVVDTNKSRRLRDSIIEITFEDGTIDYAFNGKHAARIIGCSKQLVYQVLSERDCFRHFKTACGCKLRLIDYVKDFVSIEDQKKLAHLQNRYGVA